MVVIMVITGCEGGIDLSGDEEKDIGVTVNMTIVMKNNHSVPVNLRLLDEMVSSETLVPAKGARTVEESINLTSDSRYEHIYDLVIKASWDGGSTETTHHVDYKKYTLDFSEGLDAPPFLNLLITASFDGAKITVTETSI